MSVWFKVRYTVPSDPTSGTATPAKTPKRWQLVKRIDWVGTLLLASWVGAALIAVSLNANSTSVDAYPWTSPVILGLFGASAVLFVVFLFVELKWAAEPVMPFELLHRRTPMAVALNNFIISTSLFGCVSRSPRQVHDLTSDVLCPIILYRSSANVSVFRRCASHPQRRLWNGGIISLWCCSQANGTVLLAQLFLRRCRCVIRRLVILLGYQYVQVTLFSIRADQDLYPVGNFGSDLCQCHSRWGL